MPKSGQPVSAETTRFLLELIAEHGEMRGQDLVTHVCRLRGDYTDFYPLAGLMHAGFVACDTTFKPPGQPELLNSLGSSTQDAAIAFAQLALPAGEAFQIEGCVRESWHDFPIRFFLTGPGYLKLDLLREQTDEVVRKRRDHWIALGIAIVAAIVSATATNWIDF